LMTNTKGLQTIVFVLSKERPNHALQRTRRMRRAAERDR
jgi:hypothetical protein